MGKPAWACICVSLTHFQGHRDQLCEIHHINDVTTITEDLDEQELPNEYAVQLLGIVYGSP